MIYDYNIRALNFMFTWTQQCFGVLVCLFIHEKARAVSGWMRFTQRFSSAGGGQ